MAHFLQYHLFLHTFQHRLGHSPKRHRDQITQGWKSSLFLVRTHLYSRIRVVFELELRRSHNFWQDIVNCISSPGIYSLIQEIFLSDLPVWSWVEFGEAFRGLCGVRKRLDYFWCRYHFLIPTEKLCLCMAQYHQASAVPGIKKEPINRQFSPRDYPLAERLWAERHTDLAWDTFQTTSAYLRFNIKSVQFSMPHALSLLLSTIHAKTRGNCLGKWWEGRRKAKKQCEETTSGVSSLEYDRHCLISNVKRRPKPMFAHSKVQYSWIGTTTGGQGCGQY